MRLVHGDHVCSVCESSCDDVTRLKRLVRVLELDVHRLAWELVHARELRDVARSMVHERFPAEAP